MGAHPVGWTRQLARGGAAPGAVHSSACHLYSAVPPPAGVEVLAQYKLTAEEAAAQGHDSVVVAVRSGPLMATAFHPELTQASRRGLGGCGLCAYVCWCARQPRWLRATEGGSIGCLAVCLKTVAPHRSFGPRPLPAGLAVARAVCADGAAACGQRCGGGGGSACARPLCQAWPCPQPPCRPAFLLSQSRPLQLDTTAPKPHALCAPAPGPYCTHDPRPPFSTRLCVCMCPARVCVAVISDCICPSEFISFP